MANPSRPAPVPARPAAAPAAAARPAAGASTATPPRDKAAKFVKLALRRTNKALRAIEGLGALSNRNSYTYTDEQKQKMFDALEGAVAAAKKKFDTAGVSRDSAGFTF